MKNEILQEQVGLVRDVEAALSISHPNDTDHKFIAALLARTEDELPRLPIQLVRRLHAAACAVEFATQPVLELRLAIQCVLGKHYDLRRYRPSGPVRKDVTP